MIEKNNSSKAVLRQQEEQSTQEVAQKPPRPVDYYRLENLSKPKPKAEDPTLKPPTRPKKVSRQTRQQLQDRALRVKAR